MYILHALCDNSSVSQGGCLVTTYWEQGASMAGIQWLKCHDWHRHLTQDNRGIVRYCIKRLLFFIDEVFIICVLILPLVACLGLKWEGVAYQGSCVLSDNGL